MAHLAGGPTGPPGKFPAARLPSPPLLGVTERVTRLAFDLVKKKTSQGGTRSCVQQIGHVMPVHLTVCVKLPPKFTISAMPATGASPAAMQSSVLYQPTAGPTLPQPHAAAIEHASQIAIRFTASKELQLRLSINSRLACCRL